MSTLTKQQLLAGIDWTDAAENNNASVGTFQEIFGDFECFLNRFSKNGPDVMATMMVKDPTTNKVKPVVCSKKLTALVRANTSITEEHIMNLPVFKHKDHSGIYVGLKGQSFKKVGEIEALDITPSASFNPEDAA